MNKYLLLLAVAPIALATPAGAKEAPAQNEPAAEKGQEKAATKDIFSTGVAKGRDILDSAISTSSLKNDEIQKLSANSLGEVLRYIPGVRAEYEGGEGEGSYSVRGLPLAANGSKFLQFQEDGLPVLEFGDIQLGAPDLFLRIDSNLAQVEAIRGGSASTFTSNSPGGVINLISKTGEKEGGSVAASTGLDYGMYRLDFDYGGRINDTLRYHVGGFYRAGEGPRDVGYTAYKGGQLKFNVTKELGGDSFIRIYGKYLDDRTPSYQPLPMKVTGSDSKSKFENMENVDSKHGSLLSRNINGILTLDGNNVPKLYNARDGLHPVVKSVGLEAKFDVSGWTISEKLRYSDISGHLFKDVPAALIPAIGVATAFGGPGATLSFANGPLAGQAINPLTLNGNGLLALSAIINADIKSYNNITNDVRASRVWDIGSGKLTATIGFYKSNQSYDAFLTFATALQDVSNNSALVNLATADGVPITQNGILAHNVFGNGSFHNRSNVSYDINAPYASVNYHIGKVAIGGSARYDMGQVEGVLFGSDMGGRGTGVMPVDVNGDGTISVAESQTAFVPLTQPGIVDYDYHYLSYSAGINFRVSDPLAVFARYSRGGRVAADRILFTPAINYDTGALIDPKDGFDLVRQTEVGVKYRGNSLALNLTGFLADSGDRNVQINARPDGTVKQERIIRKYRAYGAEFEGSVRRGPFSLTAGATYTHGEIVNDAVNPAFIGKTPRHQAAFIFEATPQFETQMFTVGATFLGTTSSYAQDTNQLKMPGYTVVNTFVQFRPADRLQLMLNVNNLFNTLGIAETTQGTIPAGGVVLARPITGRTISGSVRYSF